MFSTILAKARASILHSLHRPAELTNPEGCTSTSSKPRTSDEVIPVSQTYDSFEQNVVSLLTLLEAVSSAGKLDAISTKRAKSEHCIASLFLIPQMEGVLLDCVKMHFWVSARTLTVLGFLS